jgi:hypothetical protein
MNYFYRRAVKSPFYSSLMDTMELPVVFYFRHGKYEYIRQGVPLCGKRDWESITQAQYRMAMDDKMVYQINQAELKLNEAHEARRDALKEFDAT